MSAQATTLKTVIITGGSSGIGLETAKALLETRDYRIVLVGRNRNKLEATAKSLDPRGEHVATFVCDLANVSQIPETMQKLLSVHREIYGLVNNAGIYPFGGVTNTTLSDWDKTFDVNLKAPFALIQSLLPALSKNQNGGRIINISSTAGILPNHFAMAYSVSKAALVHLTKTLAKELGKENITVNCICPGIVRTPLHEAYHASKQEMESFYKKRGSTFPLGRVGESQDVSGAIKFFLSPEASWITGDVMIIDGGRLLI